METTLTCGDCLEVMKTIPDGSVDMVMCDPPYGTTECAWDTVIPLGPLWDAYRRILSPIGAVVLCAAQPFTSALVMSNPDWFKYDWVWVKNRPTNFVHAKNRPMRKHESLLVFSPGTTVHVGQSSSRMVYNPQGLVEVAPKRVKKGASEKTDTFFPDRPGHREFVRSQTGFPHTLVEFSTDQLALHPTAKPVALMDYMIRTYTNPGDTVLDNCMGSGTTGVAAKALGRNFIGIEMDPHYFDVASKRIAAV